MITKTQQAKARQSDFNSFPALKAREGEGEGKEARREERKVQEKGEGARRRERRMV